MKPSIPPMQNDQGAGRGGQTSVLGNQPNPPGSRAYDLSVSATNQPAVPTRRLTSTAPPSLDPSFSSNAPLLGTAAQPKRPSVPMRLVGGSFEPITPMDNSQPQPGPLRPAPTAPQRSDFPAKPEMSGWKKVLGLGAGFALGSAPLVRNVLHGQEDAARRQFNQATQDWERSQTDAARAATTAEANARAESLRNPKPEKPENLDREAYDFYVAGGMTPAEARKQVLADAQEQKPDKTPSFDEAAYQEWLQTHKGGTRLQFSKELATAKQTPERPEKPQRQLAITPDNKVIELTPGMAVPPGTKSLSGELNLTSKTEQGEQAGKSAVSYANDYLTGKQWTGPGDEALMEKFFELAKPSSGFRMTQAQIEMLQRSRDWMGSVTAKAKHAFTPEAPWFSDTQRQQIVKTMNDLARSRESVNPATASTGGKGQVVVTDPNGGQHTFPDQASADRFKKLAGIK